MTYQFHCPNGHLLEGEESQAGLPCDCPTCGVRFEIPAPAELAEPGGPAAMQFPQVGSRRAVASPFEAGDDRNYHIPCPNGHELETPPEMLEQEVMCPHCGVQFRLREKDSREYRRKQELEEERRLRKSGIMRLNWPTVFALLVAPSIILLLIAGGD